MNPADLGTKMLPARTLRILMPLAGMYVGDEVCAIVGGVGLGLAATSGFQFEGDQLDDNAFADVVCQGRL